MDPDLFITIAFCSLVFGFGVGAALIVRSALRGDPDPDGLETPDVSRNGNASLTRQGGGANGIHNRNTA
jgi:hypothetical protein